MPGETIREALQERDWTQQRLASELGFHQSYVSDIIRGRRSVTPRVAIRLETVLGISADLWLGLQSNYDLAVARRSLP